MSIAVAVRIRPSLLLRIMLVLLLAAVAALALWLLIGRGHALSGQRGLAAAMALALLLAAAAAWRQSRRIWRPCRLDVLASGQLFLTWAGAARQPVRMLPGSTLWPACLLLCLQETGSEELVARLPGSAGELRLRRHVLPVLPDSVSAAELRALLVACRWLEARQGEAGGKKIL